MEAKASPSIGFAELKSLIQKRREAPNRSSADKRRENRYQTNDAVKVEILQTGFPSLEGFIVDVSRSGLCLFSPSTIGRGSQVKLTIRKHLVIFGEIQYCKAARGGFHCGIVIHDLFSPGRNGGSRDDRRSHRT